MLTVQKFLELAPFKELEVVSGHDGLHNAISSVNIMDNPDALDWFSVGELLLTSGYFFKDSVALQDELLRKLKTINCPALCIKPHRYLHTIPENMIALSNELAIPIIKLPYGLSFSKISGRIMQELSSKFDSLNKQSLDIHTQFFNISLHGGGLQHISLTLSSLCEASVLLLDPDWGLLYYTDLPNQSYRLSSVFSLTKGQVPFTTSFIENFPPEFEKLQKPIVRAYEVRNQTIFCTILPVYFQSKHYGFIVLIDSLRKMDEYTYIALENGAMAFSLERIRSDEVARVRNRIRRDFLEDLLVGNVPSKESLTNFADLHGIDISLQYTAVLFPITFSEAAPLGDLIKRHQLEDQKLKQILKVFDQMATRSSVSEIVFSRKNRIIILFGTSSKQSLIELVESKINRIMNHFPEVRLTAAIGSTVKHLRDVHESFHLAQETHRLALLYPVNKDTRVYLFSEFMVEYFLMENVEQSELIKLFRHTLGSLYQYDQKHASYLMQTLDSFILNRLNLAKTARALFIHRNTLLYRLDKIQCILAVDLKNSEELLKVQLGLKVYRLLELDENESLLFLM